MLLSNFLSRFRKTRGEKALSRKGPSVQTDIDRLIVDRKRFDSFIYLSPAEALREIRKRQSNSNIKEYVNRVFPEGIPEILKDGINAVLFRHVATTNFEISRFLMLVEAIGECHPLILEYTSDRFLSRNDWKHSLGKLRFNKGLNSAGEYITESKVIIDFNVSDNKPISEVKTLWGEGLVDFHHKLFFDSYPKYKDSVYDVSMWLRSLGGDAKTYYKKFLTLFLMNGILFENFMLEKNEKSFTRNIVIPAVFEIEKEIGVKPIVIALEPTEVEGDAFWLSHPYEHKKIVDNIL